MRKMSLASILGQHSAIERSMTHPQNPNLIYYTTHADPVDIDSIEIIDRGRKLLRVYHGNASKPTLVRTADEYMLHIIQKKVSQEPIKEFYTYVRFNQVMRDNHIPYERCSIEIIDKTKGLIILQQPKNGYEFDHRIKLDPILVQKIIDSKVKYFPQMTIVLKSGEIKLDIPTMNSAHIVDKPEEESKESLKLLIDKVNKSTQTDFLFESPKVIQLLKDKIIELEKKVSLLQEIPDDVILLEEKEGMQREPGEEGHLEIHTSTELMGATCTFENLTSL